jgi:release factor glutamine methyltransferase
MSGDARVGAVQRAAAARLEAAGVDGAHLDARVLMAFALGRDAGWLIGHRDEVLASEEQSHFEALVARRAAREPLAYITGEREFWSLPFRVSPATLIPRPDTETLVEAVLAALPDRDGTARILDLGTGSGCIVLALLHERPAAQGVGIDIAPQALDVAKVNANALGLAGRADFRAGSWFDVLAPDETFDVIVTNPPYITENEMVELAPEISGHEPPGALAAGADGLDAYRQIFAGLAGRLRTGGVFAGEIGHRQGMAAVQLARAHGLEEVRILDDQAGRARVVTGRMGS